MSTNKLGNLVMLVITTSFAFTNKPHGCLLHFWKPESLHNLYNVPSEPERAAEAREARRSCELFEKYVKVFTETLDNIMRLM